MESKIDECVCEKCGSSWPCAAAKKRHLKAHKNNFTSGETTKEYANTEVVDEFEEENDFSFLESSMELDEAMPIISNISTHLVSPFVEELSDEFVL